MQNSESQVGSVRSSLWTAGQWVQYFQFNRENLRIIPWYADGVLSATERDAISSSLAEFQLGESSEGKHLIRFAKEYADQSGDAEYATAMGLFIAEENRHARDLGRFMDLHQIPPKQKTFTDTVFRSLRKVARLEMSIGVLVTAEIIAQVYYRALRDSTRSRALYVLCTQILNDEREHVRFQSERLAILRHSKRGVSRSVRKLLHRILMGGTIPIVWRYHSKALQAGGVQLSPILALHLGPH